MKITWLGHACFAVESEGWRIVLDPYTMDAYPPLHTYGNAVFCSHGHADHNYAEAVELRRGGRDSFTVETVATFHDEKGGALRGGNLMHILRAEGLTVVHCGDLGHFPTEEQLAAITDADALLIPVGGFYTIDAETAKKVADAAKARVVVPMHYRHEPYGLRPVGTLDQFTKLCDSVRYLDGNSFTLTATEPAGVIVPKYVENAEN